MHNKIHSVISPLFRIKNADTETGWNVQILRSVWIISAEIRYLLSEQKKFQNKSKNIDEVYQSVFFRCIMFLSYRVTFLCNVLGQIHYTSESPVRYFFYEKVVKWCNYIMYELYYSYRSTLEKCEFQELYQSLWVEVLADLPRFNPDLGRATTFFRYSIKHAVCIFVSFKKYNTTPYLANQLEKIKKIQQECEESGTPFTVELASKYLHCTIPTVLNYQVKLGMESSFSYEVISVTNKYFSYDSYDEEATDSKPISSYSDAELRKLVKDFSEKELCLLNMYLQMCTQENSYNIEEFRKAKASQSAMTKAETEQAIIKIEDLFKKIGINKALRGQTP